MFDIQDDRRAGRLGIGVVGNGGAGYADLGVFGRTWCG
jgi:hypothetical protein